MSANISSTFPDEISVSEHWISLTKSYEIETKTQKLGTVYRRFFSVPLTYDFYDPRDIKVVTANARFFSFGVHMDIYNQQDVLIGAVKEEIFTFYPSFEILARDSATILARAEMNFWATKFYVNDPETDQEMAIMSRSFFRVKNDWTINFTDKDILEQKKIDPSLLITVLAVQGEIEYWKEDSRKIYAGDTEQSYIKTLSQQIKAINISESLDKLEKPDQKSLEALTEELDKAFNASNPSINHQQMSHEERIKAYTTFCLNLVNSPSLPKDKKKAILTLLNLRLQGHD
jgi:uncharacterized protein YxjI